MRDFTPRPLFSTLVMLIVLVAHLAHPVLAEDGDSEEAEEKTETKSTPPSAPPPPPALHVKKGPQKRKYMTDAPDRSDAGVFHVGAAGGGNFFIEPKLNRVTKAPLGDYFKDFGFQAGVYFDYDYSELDQNIPLLIRGMVGYKYILSSIHVFTVDGVVRRQFRFSEHASFGLGAGISSAIWFRAVTDTSPTEEIIFLPSFIINSGFEFDPFMVDFKWMINRVGQDSTIMGFELSFGFRL